METPYHEQYREETLNKVWKSESIVELRQIMEEENEYHELLSDEVMPQAVRYEIRSEILDRMREIGGGEDCSVPLPELFGDVGEKQHEKYKSPLNANTYSYISFLMMSEHFCSLLFEVNSYSTEKGLRDATDKIDDEVMENFGEDAADLMSKYIQERIRLIRAGKQCEHSGISGVVVSEISKFADEFKKNITEHASNAKTVVDEVAEKVAFIGMEPDTGKSQ